MTAGVVVALGVLLAACGPAGGEVPAEPAVHHPFAVALVGLQSRFGPIPTSEGDRLNSFLRYAAPGAPAADVERAGAIAGAALVKADPAVLADFVVKNARFLYASFFRKFNAAARRAIADDLDGPREENELARLRMQALVRPGASWEGTLLKAVADVDFEHALTPRPLPLAKILKVRDADAAAATGAAEILAIGTLVEEGEQPRLAIETWRGALGRWPDDPALVAGLGNLYLENAERYPDDLRFYLEKASKLDPENAAWPALRAAAAFHVGKDEEALAAIREARHCSRLTFYSITRAKRMAATLEKLGYGPLRARLTAYRAVSTSSWYRLKDLANRALQRSYEYEAAGAAEKLLLVVDLPEMLDRQMRACPRMVLPDSVRATILANGLVRLSEIQKTQDPEASRSLADRAHEIAERNRSLEAAGSRFSGPAAWARFYGLLGEKKFLAYVDGVLFGNETDFLLKCSGHEDPADVADLTQQSYPF